MTTSHANQKKVHATLGRAGRAALVIIAALQILSCRGRQEPGAALSEEQALREKIAALSLKERVLTADYSLAKNPAPYLSLDFAARKVELRIQGRVLRTYGIARIRRSGGLPAPAQVWIKTETRPLQNTERGKVVPGSGEATTASLAAKEPWGPKRMPADYDLICKENVVLEIRSLPAESRNRMVRWFVGGYRKAADWGREVFGRRNAGYREVIEAWLSEDEARLLFWSLPRQFGILLLNVS